MQNWMLIYSPPDQRQIIKLALVFDYEKNEYALASEKTWYHDPHANYDYSRESAQKAIAYAKALAEKHGKTYEPCEQAHAIAGISIHDVLDDSGILD